MSLTVNNRKFTELEVKYLESYQKNYIKYYKDPDKLSIAIDFLNDQDDFKSIDKSYIIVIFDSIIKEYFIYGLSIEKSLKILSEYLSIVSNKIVLPKLKLKFPTSDDYTNYKVRGNYIIASGNDDIISVFKYNSLKDKLLFIKEIRFGNLYELYQEKYLFYSDDKELIVFDLITDSIIDKKVFSERINSIDLKQDKVFISINKISQSVMIKNEKLIFDLAFESELTFEITSEDKKLVSNIEYSSFISKKGVFVLSDDIEGYLVIVNIDDLFLFNQQQNIDIDIIINNIDSFSKNGKGNLFFIDPITRFKLISNIDVNKENGFFSIIKNNFINITDEYLKSVIKITNKEISYSTDKNKPLEIMYKNTYLENLFAKNIEKILPIVLFTGFLKRLIINRIYLQSKIKEKKIIGYYNFDNYLNIVYQNMDSSKVLQIFKCEKEYASLYFEIECKENKTPLKEIPKDMEIHVFDDGFLILKQNKVYGTPNWKDYVQFVEGLEIKEYSAWESYYDNAWSYQIFEEL